MAIPGVERNTYIVPLAIGQTPEPLVCQLVSRSLAIRGVTVDNANSTVAVLVYPGPSPNTVPYPVPPGKSVSIAMNGPFAAYIQFEGFASKVGAVYIAVAAEAAELFNASSVSVDGPISIEGTVPVTVQGALPITTPVYPPPGAVLVDYNARLNLTASTPFPITINPGPGVGAGLALFTLFGRVRGFNRQPFLHWRIASRADAGNYNLVWGGYGDDQTILPATYLMVTPPQSEQGVYFEVVNAPAIVGNLDCFVAYSGYYL